MLVTQHVFRTYPNEEFKLVSIHALSPTLMAFLLLILL